MRSNPSLSPGTRDGWARGLRPCVVPVSVCGVAIPKPTCTATLPPRPRGRQRSIWCSPWFRVFWYLAGLAPEHRVARDRTGPHRNWQGAAAISGLPLSVGTLVLIGGVAMALH